MAWADRSRHHRNRSRIPAIGLSAAVPRPSGGVELCIPARKPRDRILRAESRGDCDAVHLARHRADPPGRPSTRYPADGAPAVPRLGLHIGPAGRGNPAHPERDTGRAGNERGPAHAAGRQYVRRGAAIRDGRNMQLCLGLRGGSSGTPGFELPRHHGQQADPSRCRRRHYTGPASPAVG